MDEKSGLLNSGPLPPSNAHITHKSYLADPWFSDQYHEGLNYFQP